MGMGIGGVQVARLVPAYVGPYGSNISSLEMDEHQPRYG
jgi:hypothetical protein